MKRSLMGAACVALLFGLCQQGMAAGSVWDKIQESYREPLDIKVYHSPTCGCCKEWLAHLKKHGFKVTSIETPNVEVIKQQHQLPPAVASCHTALIDGYIIEGHVPANDIKRLLKQRPNVRGLAVPQMPTGAPGMEDGDRKDPFVVVSFDKEGNYLPFHQYWAY